MQTPRPTALPRLKILALSIALALPGSVLAGACGTPGGPSVLNVFENGYISLNGDQQYDDPNGSCHLTFIDSDQVNVTDPEFYEAGHCGPTATDNNVDQLDLKSFPLMSLIQGLMSNFPIDFNPLDAKYSSDNQVFLNTLIENSRTQINVCDGKKSKRWYKGNTPEDARQCDDQAELLEDWFAALLTGAVLPQPPGSGNPLTLQSGFDFEMPPMGFPTVKMPSLYDEVEVSNGRTLRLSPTPKGTGLMDFMTNFFANFMMGAANSDKIPMIIEDLTVQGCNGQGGLELMPGDYFITNMLVEKGCNITVLPNPDGTPGRANVHVYNMKKLGGDCINMNACSNENSDQQTMLAAEQHPERLAFYIHEGDMLIQNRQHIAASIYVQKGKLKSEALNLTFIGEIVAENIGIQNNRSSYFKYMDTDSFDTIYHASASKRDGEYSLAPQALPRNAKTGDLAFVPVQTDKPSVTGNLKAYALKKDGSTDQSATWNAQTVLNAVGNKSALFYTEVNGTLTTFQSANKTVPATIAPPQRTQPVIMGNQVYFMTGDGILYAFTRSGTFKWAFLPSGYTSDTKDNGQIAIVPNADNATDGYLVASYNGGARHFALEINADGSLKAHKWDHLSAGGKPMRPLVLKLDNVNWVFYVNNLTESSTKYSLTARKLADGTGETKIQLSGLASNETLSAAPIALKTLTKSGETYRLFFGGSEGNVYTVGGIDEIPSGNGKSPASLNLTSVGDINPANTDKFPVLGLEHADMTDVHYITAVGKQQLFTFATENYSSFSNPKWASYATGAMGENGASVTACSNDHAACIAGAANQAAKDACLQCIQSIPADAKVTGNVNIAFGNVYLPIQYETETKCEAYNYLYKLETGYFPTNLYYFGKLLTDNLFLGTMSYEAFTPQLSILNGQATMFSGASMINQVPDGLENLGGYQQAGAPTKSGNLTGYPTRWRELVSE